MEILQRNGLTIAVLGSGSKGNATWIGCGDTGVLIDCGLSTKQIKQRLEAVVPGPVPIQAVLLTHDHRDHVAAAPILGRSLGVRNGKPVPFVMTPGTLGGLQYRKLVPDAVETVRAGQTFRVGPLEVMPFSVPHDTADPVAWRVGVGDVHVGIITDLGRPTYLVEEQFRKLHLAVLEFNHDEEMLMAGSYTWELKQRIRSNRGHLSNLQASEFLVKNLEGPLRHLVLGHLSEENNRPVHALAAATAALKRTSRDGEVSVAVAPQHEPLPVFRLALP